ncbi:MAG TPA: serine/threonine-protein kinase [Deferrisomatales bacterium]|nr:serine/threonine-protein kinase [Deferrisomatales bacterium]
MEQLGRYRILSELGQGAMGVVYRAHDPNLDVDVALKVLRRERLSDESAVRRFLAEARALSRLEHPNTVRVFNVEEAEGTVYIAMELVEGQSLGAVAKQRRFQPVELARLGAAVAEALEDAHRKGVVHRDVKPGNILIRSDGRIKITDFGIARIENVAQDDRTQVGEILGTPSYMAPEQVMGETVDGRSDVFSLGVILYELATGTKPFRGDAMAAVFYAVVHQEPKPPSAVNPEVPKSLEEIILRCMQKAPEKRFPTAAALADALRGFAEPSVPPALPGHRGLFVKVVGPLALLLAVVTGYLAVRHEAPPPVAAPAPVASGTLKVQTEPAGAQLFLGGGFQGVTPVEMTLPAGRHEVRLTLPGYADWEAQVRVRTDRETPLTVQLTPQ